MSEECDRLERAKAELKEYRDALEMRRLRGIGTTADIVRRDALDTVLSALEAAEDEARRWYLADGSFEELDPAQVIERRKAAAKELADVAALRAEVERLRKGEAEAMALVMNHEGAIARLTRERDESRAREARLEMALRGQATRLLPDGGVCYCDIQRSDECRNEPPCVEARAALASGESREGETCWLIEAPAGAWGWQSVHWWCGQQEGGAEWTADATIAVRFLRREDAEAVLNFLTDQLIEVGGGVRVTEHVFLRRALASGESREEATIKESLIVHPFTPCLLEGIEPGHNFTCGLLCTVCGLPEDKHPASAGPAEEPGRETR